MMRCRFQPDRRCSDMMVGHAYYPGSVRDWRSGHLFPCRLIVGGLLRRKLDEGSLLPMI
jgi:hypothetical protein